MTASMRVGSVLVFFAAVAVAGCATWGSPVPPGRPVREVYDSASCVDGRAIEMRVETPPDASSQVRPVIYPCKVFAVWVPEHLDRERDLRIGGHWIYMKVRDASWTEEAIDREPVGGAPIGEAETERLRATFGRGNLGPILVPHREDAAPVPYTSGEWRPR